MYTKIKSENLNFIELTSLSIKIFYKRIIAIFFVILLFNLPVRFLAFFITNYVINANIHPLAHTGISILENFIILIPTMCIIFVANSELDSLEMKLNQIFKKSLRLWRGAIVTYVIENIIIFILLILLIIPGIIWMVYYTFSMQAVTLKNLTGKAALDYSKSLVRGHWWKVFLIGLAYGLIYYVIFWILKMQPPPNGDINLVELIIIPLRELIYAFLIVVTNILFINREYLNEKESDKPKILEYLLTKTGSEIDDSEVDFDYGQENMFLICPVCGNKLFEIYEICPECGEVIPKEKE